MATQSGLAFSLFEGNKNITHQEFVKKFLEQFPTCSPKNAALYWQNKARRAKFGLAPVQLPGEYKDAPAAPKAKKTKEVPAKKMVKDVLPPAFRKASKKVEPDNLAEIKAKNLARMKEVSAKTKKYNQVARSEGRGVKDYDADEARAEVASLLADDSFKAPKFLSKDEVKALV
jgi:hypothetical protein